ncbi:MAG: hypothetical protein L0332_12265, partial [Chloroflexi bacterium]|nr:hypothetical protein [Chloroflexota bacterium]
MSGRLWSAELAAWIRTWAELFQQEQATWLRLFDENGRLIPTDSMPRQNRVTPFSDIIVTSARGDFMGNRGCLHNNREEIVRPYANRRWILCLTSFKNRRRPVMPPGRYTALFFLDEATALSAGHRPCA